ncbi:acyl-CoA-binding domain-containing protein 6-like isoform X2 [Haliotis rubra]|nr:acyl-CoA-binding domain-containing protein 6-like isoform X2 [Haliotis rubra]XP_046543413.1 acyl-CoA-binding domain-containing protein 6-like isoform X2 [Haliotis rubra]XP_046543414.1 acyl-CoA-binding domain-containing protein 6-like isoform X2 [Haliotis rubra]XP_046543415.1 acyl-CoA-binding domain-containing protein 6-like isoform X2 [Haliotis rubra]XP_046543416.1 acyl-CoA-binding domain-containing protein 6-like isoform X2 [Haliotis rubra]
MEGHMENVEELFKSATKFVRTIAGKIENEALLYFYARFKQVKEGPCRVPKPGMFDFQGKQKWEAWKKLGTMSRKKAMMEYVSFLSDIHPHWEDKSGSRQSAGSRHTTGMGICVSTMANTDEQLADQDKTVFDWCKEGNTEKVCLTFATYDTGVNKLDPEGLALLHWASDRGYKDMVELLLVHKADVNVKDQDGQTPLHYAVSCEHVDVTSLLLSHGADVNIRDNDGVLPIDCATENLKSMLLQPDTTT